MGTSGAYGGSGTGAWDDAHAAYEQAAGPPGAVPPITKIAEALIAALRRGNRPHRDCAGDVRRRRAEALARLVR